MKIINLRNIVPIEQAEYARKALPLFGILAVANFLFAYLFVYLHESYFLLGGLFTLNAVLAFRLSFLTWRRLLYFTGGKRRLSKTLLLAFFAELFPLYHLYLIYQCMNAHEKKSRSGTSLALRPLLACLVLTVSLFSLSFPRAPKALGIFLDPTLTYVSHIALDSYRVFKLQDRLEKDCIQSDDWKCFQKAVAKEVFPGTNTAIILAVAADALIIYKKKEQGETNVAIQHDQERLMMISRVLLETNAYFLKENNCHKRITPMNISGPIPIVTGLQNGYILQFIDTLISREFAKTAQTRLTEMADSTLLRTTDQEASRSIASIKESIMIYGSETCGVRSGSLAGSSGVSPLNTP